MAGIVKIEFKIAGEDAVLRSIRTIKQSTEQAAKASVKADKEVARQAVQNVRYITSARAKAANDDAAIAKQAVAAARQAERDKVSAVRDASREKVATIKATGAKEAATIKASTALSIQAERTRLAETRAADQKALQSKRELERSKEKATQKDVAARRAEDRAARQQMSRGQAMANETERDDLRRWSRRAKAIDDEAKLSQQATKLRAREESKALRTATAATRGTISDTGAGAMRGFRSGVGALGAGAGLISGAIGTQGIISSVQSAMDLESQAAQLVADVHSGDAKFLDQKALVSDSQTVAKDTGIKAEDVMAALGGAAAQGGGMEGLNAFRGGLRGWGQLALASGTSIGDLASVSATMSNNGISNSQQQLAMARNINAAAKTGNVGFREMAANVQEVAGAHQAQGFEGNAERRIGLASGMIQMARAGGAGSAAEAATSARAYMADLLGSKAQKFMAANGIKAYTTNEKGQKVAKDVEALTIELFKKTKGDPQKLGAIFDQRSLMTKSSIDKAFKADGVDGIKKLFAEFTGAKQSSRQVDEEAEKQKATTANQVARAMENFKAEVGTNLLPVLTGLIPEFAKLATTVAGLAKDFAESPKTMIAKFLALATAAGAAQGAITNMAGRMGSWLLDKFMGTRVAQMIVTAGSVSMSGAAGAIAGNPIGAFQVATAGIGGAMLGYGMAKNADVDVSKDVKAADTRGAALEAYGLAGTVKAGKGTAADRARLVELQKTIQTEQSKTAWDRFKEGTGKAYDDLASKGPTAETMSGLALRGVGDAVFGGQQAGDDKTSQDALKTIAEALAKSNDMSVAATQANTTAIQQLPAAIAAATNLQGPKAPAP